MRVTYDRDTDTMTIALRDERIRESDEIRPGVIADFGYDGGIFRFEILRASLVIDKTNEMQSALQGPWPSRARLHLRQALYRGDGPLCRPGTGDAE